METAQFRKTGLSCFDALTRGFFTCIQNTEKRQSVIKHFFHIDKSAEVMYRAGSCDKFTDQRKWCLNIGQRNIVVKSGRARLDQNYVFHNIR